MFEIQTREMTFADGHKEPFEQICFTGDMGSEYGVTPDSDTTAKIEEAKKLGFTLVDLYQAPGRMRRKSIQKVTLVRPREMAEEAIRRVRAIEWSQFADNFIES